MNPLFTIGHSVHPIEVFIDLLLMHSVTAVCDVRSNPYSRFNPQYNRETLAKELKKREIAYVFLGKELGPRTKDNDCFVDGKMSYKKLAQTNQFQEGLKRIRKGVASHVVALMCAEKDPIKCHRMILVCRHLRSDNMAIHHIRGDGTLEENKDSEKRLMKILNISSHELLESPQDFVELAYDTQANRIAYVIK